jgi:polygalacturonase
VLTYGCVALAAQPGFFNVLDFGARNDGSARSTDAIRKAIKACSAAGGGTVYFPAGTYVTGHIELASNLTLFIDAGATLRFHADLAEYPFVKGRFEDIEGITPAPLIGGENLENVTITGRGTLTTDHAAWIKLMDKPEARDMWENIQERLEKGLKVPEADYRKAAYALRPNFIRPMNCKNVLIEGIHIVHSSMWVIHILYCDQVVVRNVTIETYNDRNGDGIDVDSSRNVRISDCYLDTGDDSIVIKSGRDADGRRVNRPTENVTITNCVTFHGHGSVVIGSETAGSVRNVVASNIVSSGTQRGIRIKSGRGRGGVVENIRFDNWVIEDAEDAINVTNYYTKVPQEPVSARTPIFRNIAINHVTVNRCNVAVNIEGLPEMPINGLRLTDVIASARNGLRAYDTVGLELHDVQINPEEGPAFLIKDSKDLELSSVACRRPNAGAPVIRLDNCPGAIIRGSKEWGGTAAFVSVGPGQAKTINLEGGYKIIESDTDYWKDAKKRR